MSLVRNVGAIAVFSNDHPGWPSSHYWRWPTLRERSRWPACAPEPDIDPQLVEELAESCAGLSALESALLIAEGMRHVYGGEWQIEANTDGSFAIMARN